MVIGKGFGPSGGSLPEWVIRTGAVSPMNPACARRDIQAPDVIRTTRLPTGTAFPTPSGMQIMGVSLGHDNFGRHVREFPVRVETGSAADAKGAAAALTKAARFLRDQGIATAAPELVGGPIAALARGEAVVLRWPNGIAIKAAL